MSESEDNQLWRLQKRQKEKISDTPEMLIQSAYEYFDWCDNHPYYKFEAVKSGSGLGTIISVPVLRPYSLGGLCVFLGCSRQYFNLLKQNRSSGEDLVSVVERIETIIEAQQFEGAVTGIFNSTIISRQILSGEQSDSAFRNQSPLIIEVLDNETKKEIEKLSANNRK